MNALIVEISDEQIAVGRHGDAPGRVELAGAATCLAYDPLGRAVQPEHLHPVVEILGNIKLVAIDSDIHRPAELARFIPRRAELAFEVAVQVEHLYPAVPGIGDEHLAVGHGDSGRVIKLPRTAAFFAPRGHKLIRRLLRRGRERKPAARNEERKNDDKVTEYLQNGRRLHTRISPQKLMRKPALKM